MPCFTIAGWLQVLSAVTILVAVGGSLWHRVKTGKGMGVRVIQFVAASSVVPGMVILAIEGKLDGSTTAALMGAFVGYLFSSIAKFDEPGAKEERARSQP
jgi:hypothetical protein